MALEKRLSDALGLAGHHRSSRQRRRQLQVRYRTLEQLDDVVRRLESGAKPSETGFEHGGPRIRKL